MRNMQLARRFIRCVASAALAFGLAPATVNAAAFDGWAAIVVAGDYRAHSGAPAEVFDNARRDIAAKLTEFGFSRNNIRTFSVRPILYADMPLRSDLRTIGDTLRQLTISARAGCFIYLTSHGAPNGIVLGDYLVSPSAIGEIVDEACGNRPTIIYVSACYSGVFVAPLAADNRMIVTAARPDRTSFGCSEDLNYTFFDQCVLESASNAQTFLDIATRARECVGLRESAENVAPPSEPQIFVGSNLERLLKFFPFGTSIALPVLPPSQYDGGGAASGQSNPANVLP